MYSLLPVVFCKFLPSYVRSRYISCPCVLPGRTHICCRLFSPVFTFCLFCVWFTTLFVPKHSLFSWKRLSFSHHLLFKILINLSLSSLSFMVNDTFHLGKVENITLKNASLLLTGYILKGKKMNSKRVSHFNRKTYSMALQCKKLLNV